MYRDSGVKYVSESELTPLRSDTFTGAYAAEYVRQQKATGTWDIKKAVDRACAAGALTVTEAGAQDGIPWADQIDKFVQQAPKASSGGDVIVEDRSIVDTQV